LIKEEKGFSGFVFASEAGFFDDLRKCSHDASLNVSCMLTVSILENVAKDLEPKLSAKLHDLIERIDEWTKDTFEYEVDGIVKTMYTMLTEDENNFKT